jgi:hypothetical protein
MTLCGICRQIEHVNEHTRDEVAHILQNRIREIRIGFTPKPVPNTKLQVPTMDWQVAYQIAEIEDNLKTIRFGLGVSQEEADTSFALNTIKEQLHQLRTESRVDRTLVPQRPPKDEVERKQTPSPTPSDKSQGDTMPPLVDHDPTVKPSQN